MLWPGLLVFVLLAALAQVGSLQGNMSLFQGKQKQFSAPKQFLSRTTDFLQTDIELKCAEGKR